MAREGKGRGDYIISVINLIAKQPAARVWVC